MELIGPVLEIVKSIWNCLTHQISYVKDLRKKYENLNETTTNLYARRDDINHEINKDKEEKMPSHQCKAWLETVGKIEDQINEIESEYNENKRCLRGWCPDVSSRRKLGKRMVETIDRIMEISKYDGPVVVDAPPKRVEIIPAPTIEMGTSTDRSLHKVMKWIRDETVGKIGVWGTGGIGKTTLMTTLNNLPEVIEIFDIVIWVTVSREWSRRKVQNEIAKRISLKIGDHETDDRVSRRLFNKLQEIKFLLLLDDLWNKVDLDKVGVPCPNQQNSCKIVLTTRSLDVCKMMETNENMKVEVLSKEEAWKLFHQKTGEVVDSLAIQPFAEEVVRECGGLPLAIIVVGASLRNEYDIHVWSNALRGLRSATFEIGEMVEEIFKPLKFSYDRLKDDHTKNCFLYAALFPEDGFIAKSKLIEYWRGEGLLCDVKTLVEASDKGHTILKYLIDASLFETTDNDLYIKLHDVIRDLALRITSPLKHEGCRFLVKAGVGLTNPPEDEEWEQAERISLMQNNLECLPENPKCGSLSTLLIQRNQGLASIPRSFFVHMPSLRVLDLSYTSIKSLPESICRLVNLRALYLNCCTELETLPSEVGTLMRLEVLHLSILSNLTYLPIEVVQLSRLRSLTLPLDIFITNDENMNRMQLWLLSRFSLLEDLKIFTGFFIFFGVDGMVEELCKLKELTSLQFIFAGVDYLEYFLQRSHSWIDERLTSFHFLVNCGEIRGHATAFGLEMQNEYRHLSCSGGDSVYPAIQEVLKRANDFNLQGHETIQKLSDFGLENIEGLKCCEVGGCPVMEAILEDGIDALPSLEKLRLQNLPMLKSLWKGSVPPTSLVTLDVIRCPNLKSLPLDIHKAGTLRKIRGKKEWWDALEWEDNTIKQQLQPLFVPSM